MKECIERAAVEEMLENAQLISDGEYCGYCTEDVNLGSIPAADVAPVRHGKWKPVKYNAHCSCGKSYGTYHFLCSACNHIAYSQPYGLTYCPNCGALMREDDNGKE